MLRTSPHYRRRAWISYPHSRDRMRATPGCAARKSPASQTGGAASIGSLAASPAPASIISGVLVCGYMAQASYTLPPRFIKEKAERNFGLIAAIRLYDFSKHDLRMANNYVLADGYSQAQETFSKNNWHPDYSDIRAYQLFRQYDVYYANFWNGAIAVTKNCWKAIFNFGANDKRIYENASAGT